MIWNIIIKGIIFFLFWLIIGRIAELTYRSIEHKKLIIPKIVNIQMYGFTSIFLFLLYILNISIFFEILLMIAFTTGIELLIWYIYIKIKKIRLWNYCDERANYKWIICPLFSFYWLLIALVYYYLALPWIIGLLT